LNNILPFATPALVGFLIYLQMNDKQPGVKFNPVIQQLIDALKMLPKTDQVKMIEEIIAVIKKYADQSKTNQEQKPGDIS
jgi:hypothetical protein